MASAKKGAASPASSSSTKAVCTWSTASSTGNFTLSDNDQIATNTGPAAWRTTRSVQAFTVGRHVIKFVTLDTKEIMIGLVPATPERRDHHIAQVAGLGACYYRHQPTAANNSIYDTNNGARRDGIAAANAGSTIVMTLDFTNGTLEWLINNTQSYECKLDAAGLANHALHIAFSAQSGAAIRLIADDPTPVVITESKESIDRRLSTALALIRSAPNLTILVAGPAGAGKSTFVNTCYTALLPPEDVYTETIAYAHGLKGHVSKEYTKYKLPSTNISIGDPWGWTLSNYSGGELSYIMNGNIKHGFKMDATIKPGSHGYNRNPALDDEVHGAIIILPADELKDNLESKDWWTRVELFRSQLQAHGLFGVLVITKVDLIDEKLANADSLAIARSPAVNIMCGRVSHKTGFPLSQIFAMKLNTVERERSSAIEVLTMEALARCVQQAKRYYEGKKSIAPPSAAVAIPSSNSSGNGDDDNDDDGSSSPSPATVTEKLAMIEIKKRGGYEPSVDVLRCLRACHGDIDETIKVLAL